MYVAKDTRTALQVYDPSTDDHSTERLALVGELRHALDRGEIVVHYQPKATMYDGRVRSVEALVRWQHPERGLIGPFEFVHLAEHTGLIHPLTHHVLRTALEQCREWRDRGIDLSVAVNLSVRDLVDLDLPGAIAAELDRCGLEPRASGSRSPRPCSCSTRTGRSRCWRGSTRRACASRSTTSGRATRRSPTSSGFPSTSSRSTARSSATSPEARPTRASSRPRSPSPGSLGLTTVAEGVECAQAWEQLVRLGCDVAQGYYISRPLPADELEAWLAGAETHAAISEPIDD